MPRNVRVPVPKHQAVFLKLLISLRRKAALKQAQIAQAMACPSAYISAVETGNIIPDILTLRTWLHACGTDLSMFSAELEYRLRHLPHAVSTETAIDA